MRWAANILMCVLCGIAGVLLAISCGSGPANPPATDAARSTGAPTGATAESSPPSPGQITHTDPQRYQVTYRVAARNEGFDLSSLLIYQPKPVTWDSQKDVGVVAVRPRPTDARVDDVGNGMYSWKVTGSPAQGKTLPFTTTFRLTAYETHSDPSSFDPRPYHKTSAEFRRYTVSERFVESNDPRIMALAGRIGADRSDPSVAARAFYDYVIDNSAYVLSGQGLKGAKSLLQTGEGECGDYASLFIALCRAAGIPARAVVGYWAVSGLDQTHVWAEFYLEGYGWVPVDPTTAQLRGEREFYFGNMDNQRVILNKGFNIELVPSAPKDYVAPYLQVPVWWYWGSGPEGAVEVERTVWEVTPLPGS